MFWANRTNQIAGLTLLLLPLLSIVGFLAAGPTGNLDPFARGDVEALLRAVHDSQAIFVLSVVPFVLTDAIVLPAVAALLYLVFCDRSKSSCLPSSASGCYANQLGLPMANSSRASWASHDGDAH